MIRTALNTVPLFIATAIAYVLVNNVLVNVIDLLLFSDQYIGISTLTLGYACTMPEVLTDKQSLAVSLFLIIRLILFILLSANIRKGSILKICICYLIIELGFFLTFLFFDLHFVQIPYISNLHIIVLSHILFHNKYTLPGILLLIEVTIFIVAYKRISTKKG